ncbi:MAG: DUF11 domain-containing protein [Chitinispirillaceae bacterium]|nr:DUF11 domain-containing protein [Chitinispirillaceae bacterium]
MKINKFRSFLGILVLASLLAAQGTPKLELSIAETKVNMTAAEKSGKKAVAYRPRDVIRYVITAQNVGDGVMTKPVITDPVPAGVAYVPLSAKGEDALITFSINGGYSYQAWPPTYTVKDANGKDVIKEAPPEMITHIRWELQRSLNPKERKILEFNVKVK